MESYVQLLMFAMTHGCIIRTCNKYNTTLFSRAGNIQSTLERIGMQYSRVDNHKLIQVSSMLVRATSRVPATSRA